MDKEMPRFELGTFQFQTWRSTTELTLLLASIFASGMGHSNLVAASKHNSMFCLGWMYLLQFQIAPPKMNVNLVLNIQDEKHNESNFGQLLGGISTQKLV